VKPLVEHPFNYFHTIHLKKHVGVFVLFSIDVIVLIVMVPNTNLYNCYCSNNFYTYSFVLFTKGTVNS